MEYGGRARLVCESRTVAALRDNSSDRTAFEICVRLDGRVAPTRVGDFAIDLEGLTERMIVDGNALRLCASVE